MTAVAKGPERAGGRTTTGRPASRSLSRRLLGQAGPIAGLAVVALAVLGAVLAPSLTPHDPLKLNILNRLMPPGGAHLFGTDDFGRDVFSLVLYGGRASLLVGASVMLLTSIIGVIFGVVAGFYRGLDNLLMRMMDGLMAFPAIVLAIALMAALGPRLSNVILALSIVYAPRTARLVRSAVVVIRELQYVEAAQALGARGPRILWRHILPNTVAPLLVQATFMFAYAVLAEAALSFLGVGAPPYIPTWGNVISTGRLYIQEAPWIIWFPGLAIILVGLGLNLLGDGLRDALDPRLRGTSGAS
ncbi:MAG: ABC transporter permease [Candidatus Methylomirabilales bacterium]